LKNKIYITCLGVVIITLLFNSCSTQKNTGLSRFYHNTTLKYNIYFNGNEAYKRGINRIYSQNADNYNEILPVFVDSKEDLAGGASGDMDKAIQKASKGIKLHSISAKPQRKGSGSMTQKQQDYYKRSEFNKWVDDAHLLMGKAYFIKRDYLQARHNFEFLVRQFPDEKTKHEANLYLARTFAEQRNFRAAKETLDLIEAQKDLPKKYEGAYNVIYADYYLKQKQYEDAVPKLEKAIELTKKKKEKARFRFILAQIYERMGDLNKATEMYELVAKKNNSYEMEFNARINLAKCYAMLGTSTKEIRKKLNRMLKDDKNTEYKDQIYYAIAEIDFNTGNINNAIPNYKLSSATSISNDYQKAISCLKLGEIYFERLDYKNAQVYYDSCLMYLPTTYENYVKIRTNSLNLNELIQYVDIVEFQDSVQRLAGMTQAERNKIIDKIIADIVEQEKREREMEQQTAINSMIFDQRRGQSQVGGTAMTSDGKWYFYNPSQLSYGKNEFTKKWGNRKNEDNWRRRNKASMTFFEDEDDLANSDSTSNEKPRISNPKSREYYLQDIPLTDSALIASDEKIMDALFNMGRVYKEKFSDYEKSIIAYENLNDRFPKNEYLLLSYYNLYLLNKLLNNTAQIQKYKDLIISKFPDTNYAKLLQNPNFVQELEHKRKMDEQLYIDTYDKYMDGRCDIVLSNTRRFLSENPDNELVPNFEFLNTLCVGKTSDTTEFKASLVNFMQKYSNHDLSVVAQNILEYFGTSDIQALIAELKSRPEVVRQISEDGTSTNVDNIAEELNAEERYIYDENVEHYYVIYVKSSDVDMKRLSFEIRNFNIFNFSMRTFYVGNTLFNNNYELVTVRTFKNQRQASNYSKMIANSEDIFSKLQNAEYKIFIISADNFTKLQKSRSINSYLKFFNENYPK
jgi:tetratricopeptide (TPR) repeat protein